MKKICIDARMWGIKHTGIGRYVQELVSHLPASASAQVTLIVSSDSDLGTELKKYPHQIAKFHPYSFLSQFEMLYLLLRIRPDLLYIPHFTIPVFWPGKKIITIHDLIKDEVRGKATTTKSPGVYWIKYLGYRIVMWLAIKSASKVITPSKYWKEIIAKRYRYPLEKIQVIYEGVDLQVWHELKDIKPSREKFLVYTGNLYPHKNVDTAIKAAELVNLPLKVVCSRSVFASRIGDSKSVEFLGSLSDTDLVKLYNQAYAFVFPSLYEGFGLVGLEAMACGLPVIAAKSSCLPEIYDSSAIYFTPKDANDLAEKIRSLEDVALRKKQISLGLAQVQKYSWSKMGEEIWTSFQKELQ